MSTNVRIKLGRRIKGLRKKYGYTQEKLAELAKMDYKYLQKIEGKNPPAVKIDTLYKIAKAIGIAINELVDFKNRTFIRTE
jgi:transcriptional regulator with XRE-family HTH domain